MSKTFVLDTNVLLQSPNSILSFGKDNLVVLTEAVLEEIDKFKNGNSELNYNARTVARLLDKLMEQGKLTDTVLLENGGYLKVETNCNNIVIPQNWDNKYADNRILQVCKALQEKNEEVYLISKDVMMRIKADSMGINSQDFESERAPKLNEQYTGRLDIYIYPDKINEFFSNNALSLHDLDIYDEQGIKIDIKGDILLPNQFVKLVSITDFKCSALGKVSSDSRYILPLKHDKSNPYNIKPRNSGQRFMIEALMEDVDNAPLVIIKGGAGSAKTLLSLACGLEQVIENKDYRRILICRPNVMMDEDIGFLPGSEKEKIAPLMRPILDNLEVLVDSDPKQRYNNEKELSGKVNFIFDKGFIDTQAVSYLRGRSIAKQYLIIDEAQNLTPKTALAIITRIGEGTKVVLAGDPQQCDHKYLDERTNGLSYISELMKGSPLCYQITMEDSECTRSKIVKDILTRI